MESQIACLGAIHERILRNLINLIPRFSLFAGTKNTGGKIVVGFDIGIM